MHRHYATAEKLVRSAIEDLERLLPRDGENISFYAPTMLDSPIRKVIEAKVYMAMAATVQRKAWVEPRT